MKYTEIKDLINKVISFESGTMHCDDMVQFFQDLIDSGLAWELPGTYGRQAKILLDSGFCHPRVDPPNEIISGRIEGE